MRRFWQYAPHVAVAYVRAATARAGVRISAHVFPFHRAASGPDLSWVARGARRAVARGAARRLAVACGSPARDAVAAADGAAVMAQAATASRTAALN